jgi:DNA-binding CsgD family transcriptional regulator
VATPFERALGEEAYGRFLRRAGERRAAASRLESALSCLAALGATPFVERVQTELAACGLSPMRRSGREKGRLTPQELAVARLVGTGRTNREVATQLVISVKTVEYHLGNIYAKLDLRTRAQLAAHLAGRTSSLG